MVVDIDSCDILGAHGRVEGTKEICAHNMSFDRNNYENKDDVSESNIILHTLP